MERGTIFFSNFLLLFYLIFSLRLCIAFEPWRRSVPLVVVWFMDEFFSGFERHRPVLIIFFFLSVRCCCLRGKNVGSLPFCESCCRKKKIIIIMQMKNSERKRRRSRTRQWSGGLACFTYLYFKEKLRKKGAQVCAIRVRYFKRKNKKKARAVSHFWNANSAPESAVPFRLMLFQLIDSGAFFGADLQASTVEKKQRKENTCHQFFFKNISCLFFETPRYWEKLRAGQSTWLI